MHASWSGQGRAGRSPGARPEGVQLAPRQDPLARCGALRRRSAARGRLVMARPRASPTSPTLLATIYTRPSLPDTTLARSHAPRPWAPSAPRCSTRQASTRAAGAPLPWLHAHSRRRGFPPCPPCAAAAAAAQGAATLLPPTHARSPPCFRLQASSLAPAWVGESRFWGGVPAGSRVPAACHQPPRRSRPPAVRRPPLARLPTTPASAHARPAPPLQAPSCGSGSTQTSRCWPRAARWCAGSTARAPGTPSRSSRHVRTSLCCSGAGCCAGPVARGALPWGLRSRRRWQMSSRVSSTAACWQAPDGRQRAATPAPPCRCGKRLRRRRPRLASGGPTPASRREPPPPCRLAPAHRYRLAALAGAGGSSMATE